MYSDPIYYQFKRSRKAFRSLPENEAWIAKAHKDLEAVAGDYSRIKYATPDLSQIPTKVKELLERLSIEIVQINHLD